MQRGLSLEVGQAPVSPMTRQPAQYLAFVPAFIGQVKDAAALQPIACFHFTHKRRPLGIRQPSYFISGKRHYARRVIDAGRAAQTPLLLRLERALLRGSLSGAPFVRPRGPLSAALQENPSARQAQIRAEQGRHLLRSCASIPPSRPTPAARIEGRFPSQLHGNVGIEVVQDGIRAEKAKYFCRRNSSSKPFR